MKIGIVQTTITPDKRENLSQALGIARRDTVDFLIFPELFTTGYNLGEKSAEDEGGETIQALSALARERRANVIAGSIIEKVGDRFFNTCFIIDREGNLAGRYSKRNLFKPLNEHKFFTSGVERGDIDLFNLDNIPVGIMICYDLRFSDILQTLKQRGVQIIFCPMEWPSARTDIRESFARTRAAESYSFLVTANPTGHSIFGEPKNLLDGRSSVSSPSGDTILKAGTEEGLYITDLDMSLIDRTRSFFS